MAPRFGKSRRNLVGNALKFTRNGGVNVSVVEAGDDVAISVSDTGIGMSEEQRKNLFRRYYRGTDTEGSGLGLLIVKELVFLHRGEIDVRTKLGEGSTFTIRLPKRRALALLEFEAEILHQACEVRLRNAELSCSTGLVMSHPLKSAPNDVALGFVDRVLVVEQLPIVGRQS